MHTRPTADGEPQDVTCAGTNYALRVSKVTKCTGTATLVHIRNKTRAGFEFDVELKWELHLPGAAADAEAVASGRLTCPELCDDCGGEYDLNISVTSSNGEAIPDKAALRRAISGCKSDFERFVAGWVSDIKQL